MEIWMGFIFGMGTALAIIVPLAAAVVREERRVAKKEIDDLIMSIGGE